MSEVYIRSQNKEKLYRLGGNYACVEYGEYEDIKKKRGGAEADKKRHVICISDGCLEEIGEYATKERCLEVLDEIQKACVSYLFTAGGAAVIRGGMVRVSATAGLLYRRLLRLAASSAADRAVFITFRRAYKRA